jgi:hypothetical protein
MRGPVLRHGPSDVPGSWGRCVGVPHTLKATYNKSHTQGVEGEGRAVADVSALYTPGAADPTRSYQILPGAIMYLLWTCGGSGSRLAGGGGLTPPRGWAHFALLDR